MGKADKDLGLKVSRPIVPPYDRCQSQDIRRGIHISVAYDLERAEMPHSEMIAFRCLSGTANELCLVVHVVDL
jgi:hypothetical protein